MKRLTYEYVKNQLKIEEYKLLSKIYKNNKTKLKVECPEGHQYEVTYHHFQKGSEKSCLNIIKQLIPDENIIENDRTRIINPNTNKFLELDIYIPSLNKAIGFNGEYWHESDYSKYKDIQKVDQCKEKGIDLLIIWYQDWINNIKEQIAKINEFLEVDNV